MTDDNLFHHFLFLPHTLFLLVLHIMSVCWGLPYVIGIDDREGSCAGEDGKWLCRRKRSRQVRQEGRGWLCVLHSQEGEFTEDVAPAKKSHTTYYSPDGTERKFIEARDRKLDLDREVGKVKVGSHTLMLEVGDHGRVQGKRGRRFLVRCL